jgi:ribonuclease HI
VLIFTHGNGQVVGLRVAIYFQQKLAIQLHFRLGVRCSNNQAEQLTIFKALDRIETIDIPENSPRTIDIYTDSRVTIDVLKNGNNHS